MERDESRTIDRRTILKTLGTTAAVAIGASSTAAAGHIQPGDPVRIITDYDIASYERACDNDLGPVYDAGTEGIAMDVRDCFYRGPMVDFQPLGIGGPTEPGWVEDRYVEPYP